MSGNILALIPARGGSKGVPNKNKRLVGGKPLIRYSIDAALDAQTITHVVVSTDDLDILEIARQCGVHGLKRPVEIAQDTSPVIEAVRHAVQSMQDSEGLSFSAVVLLQPTSPLRSGKDIDSAVELYFAAGKNPVCSVYRCEDNHPARMYTINEQRLRPLMPEMASLRRQDLPEVFHRNGALYVFGENEIRVGQLITQSMTPYAMPAGLSINIDTEFDLLVLETYLGRR